MNKKNSLISMPIIFLILIFSMNSIAFAKAGDTVKVSVSTATYNGEYSPANCLVMWIQKDNNFIKTILKRAEQRKRYCTLWKSVSNDVDALTGATRETHDSTLTGIWDCTDNNNQPVEDGTYQFWVEMTEDNSTGLSSHGSITIDGSLKTVNGPTSDEFPVFKAKYLPEGVYTKKTVRTTPNNILISQSNNSIAFEFPGSGKYSILMISPEGKLIAEKEGNGHKALMPLNHLQLKTGVYLIKISQSGKNYTLQHLMGF